MRSKVIDMAVSYRRLWKLLADKKISAADLRKASGVAPNTMTRLRRDEEVSLDVLGRICGVLHADVIEYIDEGNEHHDTGGKSSADNR